MTIKIFTGISTRGDLQEALAITAAKAHIPTDYVEWKLGDITGKNGGFTLVKELMVTIEVAKLAPDEKP